MDKYDPSKIEPKWSEEWYKHNVYEAVDFDTKPKKYILAELPYPSGKALHAGHMMRFTVPDIYSRYLRMKGFNVMFPIGWDAFGLPAENYAIKTGTHPAKLIQDTVANYKKSIRRMGYGIDWEREINTTDPKYYKWTQWIFLKFYQAGLAEYKEIPVWWCEQLKTVLSDEEVLTDKEGNKISERGEFPVERKNIKQWILKITKYADKLLEGLNEIDFPEAIKLAQRNWINKKVGINITYQIVDYPDEHVTCFTTRPDTNFGATFVVISPEHQLVTKLLNGAFKTAKSDLVKIQNYVTIATSKSPLERISEGRDKTGVFTGLYILNNLNNKKLPLWISDFVLNDFGTGAVVGVPAHDKRDFEFAQKFGLEIVRVVKGVDNNTKPVTKLEEVQEENGTMINSDFLDGFEIHEATLKIMDYLESKGWGDKITFYGIHDWVFSRQRYWGEPIPLVHKADGSIEAICNIDDAADVANNLPLQLPDVPDYNPTNDGASPLVKNKDWVATKAKDGSQASRETNTMPNWAGSCWYYIRYIDPKNDSTFADFEKMKYWLPVDRYFGGAEHTTMHLLYSRFWHRFLYDQKLVPTPEPYAWRMNGGILLGPDGKKMSKSRGNVIEPIEIVNKFGADALRMYIPFLGPYEETYPWSDSGIKATHRLLKNIFELQYKVTENYDDTHASKKMFHKLIRNVTIMVDTLKMNTAVSEFMIFVNYIKEQEKVSRAMWLDLLKLIAPFAPFLAEELWQSANGYSTFVKENSVNKQTWPNYDEKLAEVAIATLPVQINGKLRGEVEIGDTETDATIKDKLFKVQKLEPYLKGKPIKKLIYIPGKIVNVIN